MTQMWIFQDLGRDLGQDFRLKFGMKFGLGVMALMLSGVPLASADQLASANQPTTAGFSGEIEMGSAMSAAPASKVASGGLASGGLASGGFDADILPANIPAGNATPLAAELASINQPNLIARQTRVQFFRQMFATPAVNLIGDQGQSNDEATAGNVSGMDVAGLNVAGVDVAGMDVAGMDVAGLEASGMDVGTAPTTFSVQKAAIDSLQRKLAGRKAPNPLMPLGSVATAFHLISNGVAKLMISKLGAGHLPIYGDDGEVIGTRHATTGRLSAGRDRPQDQGQVWNNQG